MAKSKIHKLILLASTAVSLFILGYVFIPKMNVSIVGDGFEYVLMTESIYQHGTPDLQVSDIDSYLDHSGVEGRHNFEGLKDFLNRTSKPLDHNNAFFISNSGKAYSYHFFGYSTVVVPVRAVLGWFNIELIYTGIVANIVFLFLFYALLIYSKKLKPLSKLIFSLLVTFSPLFWYLNWTHPEVYCGILLASAFILYLDGKKFLALLFVCIASMQFPPLFVPALIIIVDIFRSHKFNWKTILKIGLASFWVIVPTAFYYINFGIPNLIVKQGYLDTAFVNLDRFHSFFLDIDQGLVLGLPLILFLAIMLLLITVFKKKFQLIEWIFISIIPMSYFFLQMINWSHGMAVINRYCTWVGIIFIVYYFFRMESKSKNWIIHSIAIASQVFVIFYFKDFTKQEYFGSNYNKISHYVLDNHPHLYNPDPDIFYKQTHPFHISCTDSVKVYTTPKKEITKMMVEIPNGLEQIKLRGVDVDALNKLVASKRKFYGWMYIDKKDFETIGYQQEKDPMIAIIEKDKDEKIINSISNRLRTDLDLFRMITEKAKQRNISIDSMIYIDAKYLLNLQKGDYYK